MEQREATNDQAYKDSVRQEWDAAAAGWNKWLATIEAPQAGGALTRVLLDQARPQPGDRVLDVGSGLGDPGLSAAVQVGTRGTVTCLDISGDMLAVAERRARMAGLSNVQFLEGDVETTELHPASYDIVLSRSALMYATSPLETLMHLRQSLRPGGRLSVSVWATPDKVAFAAPVGVIAEMIDIGPPTDGPGPFTLGEPGVLDGTVRQAGYADVAAGEALVVLDFAHPAACTEFLRDCAPPITELIANEPASVQADVWKRVTEAWQAFQQDDGHVRLPCTAMWASGVNPTTI